MKPEKPIQSLALQEEGAVHGIWSGTISFSLVAIPVQLVKAIEPGRVSFRMLHSTDFSPLQRKMFCPKEDKIVSTDEIIRGYEIAPDKYVLITDEELESVSPERSRTIEIVEFIDMKEVDSIFYDHPYYLIPMEGGEKAYRLLVEAMRRTNKAGLAKFVLGEREYLVAIKSTGVALALITLHYSEEVLSDRDILPKEQEADDKEQRSIRESIKKMMADFDPGKYTDIYRKKIMGILKKKAKEKAMVEAPEIEEEEAPADLMAALKESISKKVKKKQ